MAVVAARSGAMAGYTSALARHLRALGVLELLCIAFGFEAEGTIVAILIPSAGAERVAQERSARLVRQTFTFGCFSPKTALLWFSTGRVFTSRSCSTDWSVNVATTARAEREIDENSPNEPS